MDSIRSYPAILSELNRIILVPLYKYIVCNNKKNSEEQVTKIEEHPSPAAWVHNYMKVCWSDNKDLPEIREKAISSAALEHSVSFQAAVHFPLSDQFLFFKPKESADAPSFI